MPLSHFVPAYPSPSPCPQVHSPRSETISYIFRQTGPSPLLTQLCSGASNPVNCLLPSHNFFFSSSEVNFYFLADRTCRHMIFQHLLSCPSSGSLVPKVPWPKGLGSHFTFQAGGEGGLGVLPHKPLPARGHDSPQPQILRSGGRRQHDREGSQDALRAHFLDALILRRLISPSVSPAHPISTLRHQTL